MRRSRTRRSSRHGRKSTEYIFARRSFNNARFLFSSFPSHPSSVTSCPLLLYERIIIGRFACANARARISFSVGAPLPRFAPRRNEGGRKTVCGRQTELANAQTRRRAAKDTRSGEGERLYADGESDKIGKYNEGPRFDRDNRAGRGASAVAIRRFAKKVVSVRCILHSSIHAGSLTICPSLRRANAKEPGANFRARVQFTIAGRTAFTARSFRRRSCRCSPHRRSSLAG